MTARFWMGLLLALVGAGAFAKKPVEIPEQAELSMLVTGMVLVEPDGSVSGWEIDQREKLPDFVVNLIENSAPVWRFEPVLVDGQPRKAKALMSLRVVANRLDEGNYRIAIQSGYFGKDAISDPRERWRQTASDEIRSLKLAPPKYPMDALVEGVRGTVYLVVRVNRQGAVADVAVEQVDLRVIGTERQMNAMRNTLAKPALVAARRWTFEVPTTGESADNEYWSVRVPVDYQFAGEKQKYGEWQAYIPGPRQEVPWVGEDPDSGESPDAMVAGGVYEVGKGLKLLTPLQRS
ncbi:hypothetical protein FQY83_06120 [Luteimonas marina]|uniref:TonB C-terminal domain-containing protein n=1 Tax=Luteimonas marina TaxID=488485 RepID=A0A5C5U9N8_9GAMM|nr:hypothetical protein [Luteimonas marina]TWT22587.1 hypothetical protein FQY83_06120 [Luteimonas marina]